MSHFDDRRIEFACPGCAKQISETIGRLKQNPYTCPGCGGHFNTEDVGREMQKAESALDELLRKLHSGQFLKGRH